MQAMNQRGSNCRFATLVNIREDHKHRRFFFIVKVAYERVCGSKATGTSALEAGADTTEV